jgi:S-(hydroxymethyl)glutathione dehydrogenase / alcohol dehydrogenase
MKAAILVENKKPLVVADIDLPKDLEYGQVLVRVHYSGICGAQINEIEAVKGADKFLPHLLGHEGGGVVEKCGPGVKIVKTGDHVVMYWRKGEGIQSATPKYKWDEKTVNSGWVTTFNEYAVVSENRVTPIPKNYDLKYATLYGCALTTAFGVIHNDAKMKCGESIVIFGAGGVGSAIILAAKTAGAYPIIAVDINDFKLKMAKKFGATDIINSKIENCKLKIENCLGKEGADITVDTTGINKIRELAYEIASKKGKAVLVGVPRHGDKMSIDSFPLHFTKVLTGSHGGDSNPTYDIPRLVRLEQSGGFDLKEMITKVYSLDKINEAIDAVRHKDVIRCVIDMRK